MYNVYVSVYLCPIIVKEIRTFQEYVLQKIKIYPCTLVKQPPLLARMDNLHIHVYADLYECALYVHVSIHVHVPVSCRLLIHYHSYMYIRSASYAQCKLCASGDGRATEYVTSHRAHSMMNYLTLPAKTSLKQRMLSENIYTATGNT